MRLRPHSAALHEAVRGVEFWRTAQGRLTSAALCAGAMSTPRHWERDCGGGRSRLHQSLSLALWRVVSVHVCVCVGMCACGACVRASVWLNGCAAVHASIGKRRTGEKCQFGSISSPLAVGAPCGLRVGAMVRPLSIAASRLSRRCFLGPSCVAGRCLAASSRWHLSSARVLTRMPLPRGVSWGYVGRHMWRCPLLTCGIVDLLICVLVCLGIFCLFR